LAQTIKHKPIEETILEEQKQNEEEEEEEEDMNAVKALPLPPQGFTDIEKVKEDETKEKQKE
jgi:hypothetical protein